MDGNNQIGDGFWKETPAKFLAIWNKVRLAISSKWRKMHPVVNRFCGYYNNLYVNRPSGWSDKSVFKEVMRRYEDEHRQIFPHVRAWEIMRTNKKWVPVPNEVSSTKQTKT
ncbi:hypothetical protein HanIR_Chr02g0056311 [Helianthus annuus]|nr:hypothetical protein HanIR_Chr02g0056311 [Helianthus annuus]